MGYYIYSVIECNDERTFDAVPIGSTKQEAGSTKQEAGSTKHEAGSTKQEARSRKHEAGSRKQEARSTKQDDHASCIMPPASLTMPPASLTMPPASLTMPHASSVYTVCHNGLAAVVSDSEIKEYPITRENMLAHQKVNEIVMKEFVVLPVKFCTIAEGKDLIVKKLLIEKKDELATKLKYLVDKQEFGLKVFWKEMPQVFAAIVEENPPIKKLKQKLEKADPRRARDGLIEIGELVKQALDDKKEVVGGLVYERLAKLAVEAKTNQLYGDKMPLNAVFLVEKSKEAQLDSEINKLAEENVATMDWKYVGPTPAANFVEIVVTW